MCVVGAVERRPRSIRTIAIVSVQIGRVFPAKTFRQIRRSLVAIALGQHDPKGPLAALVRRIVLVPGTRKIVPRIFLHVPAIVHAHLLHEPHFIGGREDIAP